MRGVLLTKIVKSFASVLAKRAGLSVGLWGEPGIGKTFIAQAILHEVSCQHLSMHATTPASGFAKALPRAKKLPAWVERQLERMEHNETLGSEEMANTIVATLSGLAPFVLNLEDLHEANPERLKMVARLAVLIRHTRGLGLIVTSRREPPAGFSNHRLELLEESESQTMLERELGASLPADGLEWLQSRTQGNPLFALEFLRFLTRQGFLWSDGKRWNWRAPTTGVLPFTVEALIGQTIGLAASPEAKTVLEARAILPSELEPEFLVGVWAAVAEMDLEHLERTRVDLERRGLLRGLQFAHPLFAEVISHELPVQRKQLLAERALGVLEPINPVLCAGLIEDAGLGATEAANRLERVARQVQVAGNPVRAAQLLAFAAAQASGERQASLALEAARIFQPRNLPECERLARLAMNATANTRQATYLSASTMMQQGNSDGAWALLERWPESERQGLEWWQLQVQFHDRPGHDREVVQLWTQHPEFHGFASASIVYTIISSMVNLGQIESANQWIDMAQQRSDFTLLERANILERRNAIHYREARYEAIEANLNELLESIDPNVYPWECHIWYGNRSNVRVRLGKMREAKLDAEQACRLHLKVGTQRRYSNLLVKLSLAQIYLREFEEAERVLLEAVSFAQVNNPEELYDCYGHLSFLYLRWKPAHGPMLTLHYARLSLQGARSLDRPASMIAALEDCVRAELNCGSAEAAIEYAKELERMAFQTGLDQDIMASTALMGRSLAMLGDHAAAIPYLHQAAALYEAHSQHNEALLHELEIDRIEGNLEAARQKLEWFEANNDANYIERVHRYFPQLAQVTKLEITTERPSSRIEVLGAIRLEHDGQAVTTRARKRLEIIA
jgi:tetratricopeptide (TPR) repeat protein